ncbi:MAG: hypothetical protein J0I25_12125 [Sphingomonadales bacterium]|nr:hypothetical protein [Sphingomonadales bacterium]
MERLIQGTRELRTAKILTKPGKDSSGHALFLTDSRGDEIIIKGGFASGYGGSGPKGFSATLRLLDWHGVELSEIEIDATLMERLNASALTIADLENIREARPVRPHRYWDYVFDQEDRPQLEGNPWQYREPISPFALLDERLAPHVRRFWDDPDAVLMKGHRALEHAVRLKADMSKEEATDGPAAVYRYAFGGNAPRLSWEGVTKSEHAGRMNLFMGVLTAYRHVRAHRDEKSHRDALLSELLLLNHLFRLEATAKLTAKS